MVAPIIKMEKGVTESLLSRLWWQPEGKFSPMAHLGARPFRMEMSGAVGWEETGIHGMTLISPSPSAAAPDEARQLGYLQRERPLQE